MLTLASNFTQSEAIELARSMSLGMQSGDINKSIILNVMINTYINQRMPDTVRISLNVLIDSFLHNGTTADAHWEMLAKSMLRR